MLAAISPVLLVLWDQQLHHSQVYAHSHEAERNLVGARGCS